MRLYSVLTTTLSPKIVQNKEAQHVPLAGTGGGAAAPDSCMHVHHHHNNGTGTTLNKYVHCMLFSYFWYINGSSLENRFAWVHYTKDINHHRARSQIVRPPQIQVGNNGLALQKGGGGGGRGGLEGVNIRCGVTHAPNACAPFWPSWFRPRTFHPQWVRVLSLQPLAPQQRSAVQV